MALAVETPAREDMSLRTNDDKVIGARWLKSDAATPMVITSAVLTLRGDPPRATFDPDTGEPLPPEAPPEHRVDSTTPGDPNGWVNPDGLADGVVLVTVPYGIWATFTPAAGDWDIVADGEGVRRCLVRGRWYIEQGVTHDVG